MLEDVLAYIPGVAAAKNVQVERMPGGFTNINYRVEVDGDIYVVRLSGAQTALLGINRAHEYEAIVAAARIGIAPEVVQFVEPQGHIITRFISGRKLGREDIRQPTTLRRITEALKRIHTLPPIAATFSPFRIVEQYRGLALQKGCTLPENIDWLIAHMHAIEIDEQADPMPRTLCHNDVVRGNLLDDGAIRILDWEYAGMGNKFFDLAAITLDNRFSVDQKRLLLKLYFGSWSQSNMQRLWRMEAMFLFREATWALVQLAISELQFDFRQYADSRFTWLTQHLSEPVAD
jgi:thiamine kinase-like enzyme